MRTGGKKNPHQNQDIFLRGEQISPLSHKRLALCCKLRKKTGFYSQCQTFPLFHLVLISAKIDDMYQKPSQAGDISKSAQPALWLSPWQWGSTSCCSLFCEYLSQVWHGLTTPCLCSSPAKNFPFLCSRPAPSVPSCFSLILETPGPRGNLSIASLLQWFRPRRGCCWLYKWRDWRGQCFPVWEEVLDDGKREHCRGQEHKQSRKKENPEFCLVSQKNHTETWHHWP